MISRRQLLYLSILFLLASPKAKLNTLAWAEDSKKKFYPETIEILKQAFWEEMSAHTRYVSFGKKALTESYPNIAYLFKALDVSERIHANNYRALLATLGSSVSDKEYPVVIKETKANLNAAARAELAKIKVFYPEILKQLADEAHDQAILNCMYSWKSHQQHEKIILDIKKYSGFFFPSLAKKIEKMNPEYFVCEICGSTISNKPEIPCEICNFSLSHYKPVKRPSTVASELRQRHLADKDGRGPMAQLKTTVSMSQSRFSPPHHFKNWSKLMM